MSRFQTVNRRFIVQSILLFLAISMISFVGVFVAGRTGWNSANQLGTMTVNYMSLQVDGFMEEYRQILNHAAYNVNGMMEKGRSNEEIIQWLTRFSGEYQSSMIYDENGLYGAVRGEGLFSRGWEPGPDYDMYSHPWYTQAIAAGGGCARSQVYEDSEKGVRIISLSQMLADGESVLALDIRVGDIQIDWEEGSDVFPGTATVLDQDGNIILHQQIGKEHIRCELDDFTQADYQALMAQFEGSSGRLRWEGENDVYQHYYTVDEMGWTCIVTVPRAIITRDATQLFYLQLILQGIFLVVVIYLSVQNYLRARHRQKAVNCFEALGQTYYCVALVDPDRNRCEVIKREVNDRSHWGMIRSYRSFLDRVAGTMSSCGEQEELRQQFSNAALKRLREGTRDRCYMEYLRSVGGEPQWVSAEAFALKGEQRSDVILAFRMIHEDKTAELEKSRILRESLESARMASQAKNDFLSRMSHDMRTPMNAVIGFTDMARNHLEDKEKAEQCLNKVTVASLQLLHLINEVLDTAKIEQGKLELQLAPVALKAHVEQVGELFHAQAQAKGQTFRLVLTGLGEGRVETDVRRLDQILNNLVSNAVKYTPAGGAIRLEVEELPGDRPDWVMYRFRVADDGIGMSPAFLKKIFLPFEREDTSMTNQVSGVGLGMAITKNIVQLMGGQIEVESVQGEGSTFTVVLPCHVASESQPEQPAEEKHCDLTGRHFLLSEDNLLNMEIATELLEMEGARVTTAQNGQEAVEIFQREAPGTFDAILMDIQMPVLDGYGAARAIRGLDRPDGRQIPIVAMTANAFADDVIAAREAGMNGHIAKPVDIGRIKATLSGLLAER